MPCIVCQLPLVMANLDFCCIGIEFIIDSNALMKQIF